MRPDRIDILAVKVWLEKQGMKEITITWMRWREKDTGTDEEGNGRIVSAGFGIGVIN